MDPRLSEEQEILQKSARDFLTEKCPKSLVREMEKDKKGYSPQLWQEIADLGWIGLAFPEKYGGSGMSFLDLAILLEEMGKACFPGPFFSTVVVGGLPILDAGSEEQKQKYLPQITSGKAIFALALTEASGKYEAGSIKTRATADKNGYVINGTKVLYPRCLTLPITFYASPGPTIRQKNPKTASPFLSLMPKARALKSRY